MPRRLLAAGLVGLCLAAAPIAPTPATASDSGDGRGGDANAGCDGDECRVGARIEIPGSHGSGRLPTSSGGSAAPSYVCRYFTVDHADGTSGPGMPETFRDGDTVWIQCWTTSDAGGPIPYGTPWSIVWGPASPTVPAPPVEDLAQAALESMRLPRPAPVFNPGGEQVVNLPTWLAVTNWVPVSQTASAGGVAATVTARPWRQRWDLGADGGTATCFGPGTVYDTSLPEHLQHTDCAAAFTHTSRGQPGDAFAVTATVDWLVSWTSTVAGRGGDLGVLSTSATRQVRVGEIQVLNN
jgi:hypothetical protein